MDGGRGPADLASASVSLLQTEPVLAPSQRKIRSHMCLNEERVVANKCKFTIE